MCIPAINQHIRNARMCFFCFTLTEIICPAKPKCTYTVYQRSKHIMLCFATVDHTDIRVTKRK